MKGIMILGFNEKSEISIDTQFPSNICEFLKITDKNLKPLIDQHMKKKMEPNFLEIVLENEINIASFYTGFSFRHYVGKPNFAITVFLSDDDTLSDEFEGMMRRIAYELLPKREALNFDDIFGKYYKMLKSEELTSYWEETVEGEISKVVVKREKAKIQNGSEQKQSEILAEDQELSEKSTIEMLNGIEELTEKNRELEDLLNEKSSKIRELTNKYTELVTENKSNNEEIQSLKDELSEQYIKIEKWSQQMAELNENNAKLLDEIKELNEKLELRNEELEVKDKKIKDLKKELLNVEEIEKEAESMLLEKEDLKQLNLSLKTEFNRLRNEVKKVKNELDKSRNENTIHIDSITNLKLEVKRLKSKMSSGDKDKEKLNEERFDLKKEIKVLRRERDHYMKIVKDNELL